MIAQCNMRDAETRFSIDLFCCRGFFLGVPDWQQNNSMPNELFAIMSVHSNTGFEKLSLLLARSE